MVQFTLIINKQIPKGATVTPYALMPKILGVINKEGGGRVFINRNLVKKFKYTENVLKKKNNLFNIAEKKAYRIFRKLTKNGPILLKVKV